MAGETFASRVAASLLSTLGLPELITRSLAEYQDAALRLARNAGLLVALRERLEASRKESQLFNADWFARNLEKAYSTMWESTPPGKRHGLSTSVPCERLGHCLTRLRGSGDYADLIGAKRFQDREATSPSRSVVAAK